MNVTEWSQMLNLFSVPGWMVKHFCLTFKNPKNIKESRPLPRVSLMVSIPSPSHRIGSGKSRILRTYKRILRERYHPKERMSLEKGANARKRKDPLPHPLFFRGHVSC